MNFEQFQFLVSARLLSYLILRIFVLPMFVSLLIVMDTCTITIGLRRIW